MTLAQRVGGMLRDVRESRGLSRKAAAAELGWTDVALLQIETGQDNPTLGRLEKVAEVYAVDLVILAAPVPTTEEVADATPTPTP